MAINNIPEKITDKVPGFDEYKKAPKSAVSYVFMLLFFCYFIYSEFMKEDNCGSRIATLERVIIQKDDMIDKLNNRVSALEVALDIRTGVIKEVIHKTDSMSRVGGSL